MSQDYIVPFEAGYFYHVYNRAVGNDLLFFEEYNYLYFLRKYKGIISTDVETYVYSLIPNHFHFIIRIPDELVNPEKTVCEKFRRFGISYSQSINKQQRRKGSLMMRPLKRKKIYSNDQLFTSIYYIHFNAVHHRMVLNYLDHKWNSYHTLISNERTFLERKKIFELFGGKEQFIVAHEFQKKAFVINRDLCLE